MVKYEVVVGNVGTVYSGGDAKQAVQIFEDYKLLSQLDYGRVAGEHVVMFANDELDRECVNDVD